MKESLKIMKTKPEVTDEEIRGYMNFDRLVAEHRATLTKARNANIKWIAVSGAAAVIGVATMVYWFARPTENETAAPATVQEARIDKPVVESKGEPEKGSNQAEKKQPPQESSKLLPKKPENTIVEKEKPVRAVTSSHVDSSSIVVIPAYLEAEPVEGFPHLYNYFESELKYPVAALRDSLQGVVTVNFVISKEGKPENIKVANSLGPLFDEEALRLIANMPAWKPARMNGKPIRARISIPLTFRIEKK